MPYALLLFVAMPIVEIALLLRVGNALGWAPTLLIVIATAFLGTAMLRQQGLATLAKARSRLDSGEMPAQQLLEGMLLMVGGVLLLTPGFVTDAFGFACLIPLTRQWLATKLADRAILSMSGSVSGATSGPARGAHQPFNKPDESNQTTATPTDERFRSGRRSAANSDDGQIIDGDFRRVDEE